MLRRDVTKPSKRAAHARATGNKRKEEAHLNKTCQGKRRRIMSNAQEVVKLYRIESWDCQGTCETAICLRDTQRLGHGAVASQLYQEHVRNLGCRARASERASERARHWRFSEVQNDRASAGTCRGLTRALRKHACADAAGVDLRAEARLC